MFEKKALYIFSIILFFLAFSSCGEYEKLLKSGDVQSKQEKALEYYEDGQYVRAATLFEQVIPRIKGTGKAEEIEYIQAKCYYEMKDYVMAGHYFRTFVRTYFNSPHAEDADFFGAYCYYKLTNRPELDQTNTINAINSFTLFMTKFPGSDRVDECKELINEMEEVLVKKSYLTARLYYQLGKYKSTIISVKNSISDYPDTEYREELLYLKLRSSYLWAEGSIYEKQQERYQDTVDEYYSFIDEFPDSIYKREAEKLYNKSTDFLSK